MGQADVLIGGPPCQPFSKSGYWARGDAQRLDDPRADTLTAYLRILRDAQPKAFLLENVYGLAYKGKSEGLDRILAGVDRINRATGTSYRPEWQVIDAASYGVPQHRERVLLVASRDGKAFKFPAATHGEPDDLLLGSPHRALSHDLGCARRSSRATKRSSAPDDRQVGRVVAEHSRRRELSLAYAARRRHAAVRLAHALLELSC